MSKEPWKKKICCLLLLEAVFKAKTKLGWVLKCFLLATETPFRPAGTFLSYKLNFEPKQKTDPHLAYTKTTRGCKLVNLLTIFVYVELLACCTSNKHQSIIL
ncbi:hypothetical protein XENOCAPTIV_005345 [Xenoophorus captivus]|uniref:Secreted protein n=1 Tax=Xenoophorus captivus TaxID=1517983 RepID=A0ABV0SFE1_9TELE